jgi:hypothetical protein
MDYGRWMRAMEAGRVEAVERRRAIALTTEMSFARDDLEQIAEHDRWLIAKYGSL